jgi:hypothetical protein
MHDPLLSGDLGSSGLTLQRVTVSISFAWFASRAKWNVDGTVICREKGCEGVERPMTSSAVSGGEGNVASLQTYEVCTLLYAELSPVFNIYSASCPAPPDSCKEAGRTDPGRGDPCPVTLIGKHSLHIQ